MDFFAKLLNVFRKLDMDEDCQGKRHHNRDKNRVKLIIPGDSVRPILTTEVDGRTDYINACVIKMDETSSRTLITTQLPLANTTVDFWRLVNDYNVKLIVRLDGDDYQDSNGRYWPVSGTLQQGPFSIHFGARQNLDDTFSSETFLYTNKLDMEAEPRAVRMWVYHAWSEKADCTSDTFIRYLIKLYRSIKEIQGSRHQTVILQCFDGASKCGLLSTVYCLLDSLKNKNNKISIFDITRTLQKCRPQFVPDMEQYTFLHKVVTHQLAYPDNHDEGIYYNSDDEDEEYVN